MTLRMLSIYLSIYPSIHLSIYIPSPSHGVQDPITTRHDNWCGAGSAPPGFSLFGVLIIHVFAAIIGQRYFQATPSLLVDWGFWLRCQVRLLRSALLRLHISLPVSLISAFTLLPP